MTARQFIITLVLAFPSTSAFGQGAWTPAINLFTDAGDPPSFCSVPMLAAGSDGNVTAAWLAVSGETSGSRNLKTIHINRQANVYLSSSSSYGTNWTEPVRVSNSQHYNSEFDICAGQTSGEFHLAWTSGDVLSGMRMHFARTADQWQTHTSGTILQELTALEQGFFLPDIELSGDKLILSRMGVQQDVENRPVKGYLSPISVGSWAETNIVKIDKPSSPTLPVMSNKSMATDGINVVVPFMYREDLYPYRSGIFTITSADGGQNWIDRGFTTSQTLIAQNPVIATDRKGTWAMMFYGDPTSSFNKRLYFQRSTDAGESWTEAVLMPQQNFGNYGSGRITMASDGAGKWLAVIGDRYYAFSEDNALTWSGLHNLPATVSEIEQKCVAHVGNGKWLAVGVRNRYTVGGEIKISTLTWGSSAVGDWELYD